MRKLFLFTILFLWMFSVFAWGDDTEYRFIDAEETEGKLVPIDDIEDCYIMADSSGDSVYIVNKYLQKLSDSAFKCVYNKASYSKYLMVRYADIDDLSGLAVLNSDMEKVIPPNDYQTIRTYTLSGHSYFIGHRCDNQGELTSDYFWLDNRDEFLGLREDLTDEYERFLPSASDLAEERIKAADESGIIPKIFRFKFLTGEITRYELTCLALQAVLLKADKSLYDYIEDSDISLDYDKYMDIVSPNVLLADELGLVMPSESKYFYPNNMATRQEAAYTLYGLCRLFNIETTPNDIVFADDSEISDAAREAVYNVSGTPVDDTYILAQVGADSFMPNYPHYSLERAIMAVWRLYGWDSIDFESFPTKFNEAYIGCSFYAYQNTDEKWGVYGDDFETEAFYELPCESAYRYGALNDVYVLSLNKSYLATHDNTVTYYLFKRGELFKTLVYTVDDFEKDMPDGYGGNMPLAQYVSGSNVVYMVYNYEISKYVNIIKRLISEEIAGVGYYTITPRGNGEFTAEEISTGKECILDSYGRFKEYVN